MKLERYLVRKLRERGWAGESAPDAAGLALRMAALGYVDDGETANTQLCVFDYTDAQMIFEVRGLKTENLQGAKVGVIFYGSDGYLVINSYSGGAAFDAKGNMVKSFRENGSS